MRVTGLQLSNFRNYERQSVEFDDGLNILYGKNASGKTNMLESIYFAAVLRSERTTKDKEMIKKGAEKAQIKLSVEKIYRTHQISIQIDNTNKKKVLIDGIPIQRAAELIGILGVVFFSPDQMQLVKGAPEDRRRFMDVGISQQQKSYFKALTQYNKVLKQKNKLLKDERFSKNLDDILDAWDVSAAEYGSIVIKKRLEYIKALGEKSSVFHSLISGNENLSLSYESDVDLDGDIRQNLARAIEANREKDKELGYSTVGPHRDDIKIQINDFDARKYASQGQQRTVALAMKFGEAEMYFNEIGEKPVLLLDDVFSELDVDRVNILLNEASKYQTIITCTEFEKNIPANKIHISGGKIING